MSDIIVSQNNAIQDKWKKRSYRKSEIYQQSFSIACLDENIQGENKDVLNPDQLEAAKLYHIREAKKNAF